MPLIPSSSPSTPPVTSTHNSYWLMHHIPPVASQADLGGGVLMGARLTASKGNVKNGEYTAKILSLTILAFFFLDFLLFLHIFSAMKRYRTVDVPPKFRRTVKGRSTRLGESVYFNRFFSAYNLVYLKFFMMWIGCITLDFLIGFRFELLWPVWLLFRHLYESFRVHAFSSSLHYSAFSVFFVCVTATSDLVCYLFIPIQVLIFLASTYVWVQFVYQSSDRGICLPSLFLWALFIVFEYSVRYRFDNATWYLARTSWITAGLFPSTADSISVGSPSSTPSASSTRLELYRPFAAHCIGFPVVTLGFRVKSFFSNWRMRIRREEVRRQNEFYERILAEATPTSFENRKHFISSRSHLSIEQQEAIDYDSGCYGTGELLNGMDQNGQNPRLYAANQSALAGICAPNNTFQPSSTYCPTNSLNSTQQILPHSSSTSSNSNPMALFKKQQQRFTKQTTTNSPKQNGISASSAKKNGSVLGGRGGSSGIYLQQQQSSGNLFTHKSGAKIAATGRHNNQQQNGGSALHHHSSAGPNGDLLQQSRGGDETIVQRIWRTAFRFCCLFVLSTIGQLVTALWPSFQQTMESLISQFRGISSSQDDLTSTSGDGSNMADEDDWDERESNHLYQAGNTELQAILQNGKRRSRRSRGLTNPSQTSATFIEQQQHSQIKTMESFSSSLCTQQLRNETTMATTALNGGDISSLMEATMPTTPSTESSYESNEQIRENALKLGELKHLQKEKQILEQSLEKLNRELKLMRQSENELRQQLQFAQQQEQNFRNEWKQLERDQKTKIEQLENKCRQMGKQNEHFKTNIQALEKRVGELQLKKLEIERELANERLTKQHIDQQQASKNMESGEQFKQKLLNMDRELKQLKREMKAKDEQCTKLEDECRQLRSMSTDDCQLMETLKQKNFVLEQTLSAENRLKQDLFRALNDSKAEIASMKAELRINKSKEQAEMMNAFSASNSLFHNTTGGGSSTGSSPTQQHPAQQFSTITHSQKSLTPPPMSLASSPINLEQLLQATQNMSYSLGPIEMNGGTTTTNKNENSYANMSTFGNGSALSSSPYIGGEASEMLAVGGHRAAVGSNFATGIGKNNVNTGGGHR